MRAIPLSRLSHASSFLTPICRKRIAASVQLSMPSCKLWGPQDSSIHQPSRKTVVATRDWFRVQKTAAKRREHIISYNSYNILSLPNGPRTCPCMLSPNLSWSKKLITTLEKHKSMECVIGISNHRYAKAWALKIGWFGLTHLITCTGIFGRISGWICPHYSLFPIPLYWCLHFTLHSTSWLHCSTVKFSVSTGRSASVLPTFWKSALAAVARSSASQIQWLPWLLWERSVQK